MTPNRIQLAISIHAPIDTINVIICMSGLLSFNIIDNIIHTTIAIEKGKYIGFDAFEYYWEYAYFVMQSVVFRLTT